MKNVVIAKWIERLPLAPEFRPTDTEFADPIAYISKIEKEASAFGICKVIPPLPKPSRKYVLHNLNKSLSKCPELSPDVNSVDNGESTAVFTTRSQELGSEKAKKTKGLTTEQVIGAKKQVWQSGEVYTLDQFEAKSKNFAKSQLGMVKEVNPLVIETMFWKAATEKPIYIEYANDVPGSGFGQPEGLSHYFRKRRRRRKRNSFDRNNSSSSNSNKDKVNAVTCSNKADKDSDFQNNPILCLETASNSLSSAKSVQGDSFSALKDSNSSIEMEGTAGWKLSNSPWNLQVIARSPGSLTKFMPDDIPGVTSPMVYVGMLFSWFAWHVEDHELHSLNYLHMGSPKTWYSVPGDYAFDFEEIIRDRAYGGTTDRLVALSRLGEKTTIISPQVIVASGIPCCRLVQNPGEFVVTFPRAYHIGFSHGFNCGEAANFATPNWLKVAREAAVRRAAMNYLPMLSHQQLLSLLTMSFISRIPRSLLPGIRSSRLRDRQTEEREFLVKRAFIEDILYENNLLTVLLQRSSSHRSVLWDAESLPSTSKESELSNNGDTSVLASIQKDSPENDDTVDHVSQLNEYIGAVGFDLNDDDLAYAFQIDSGTLPCVACGILGFPFMTVVQPSEAALKNLLHENPLRVPATSCHLSDINHMAKASIQETKAKLDGKDPCHLNESSSVANLSQCTHSDMEQTPVPDHLSSFKHRSGFPNVEIAKGWNTSNLFLKPRIFCLCHALEIEALLKPVGGANVLVICHSDFQKIKAHVASIAEETSTPFHYNEIAIGNVSQEDLHVIDIAIDRDEQVDSADWTSQLNVNLQHYLKVKKRSPTKNVEYALSLGGLLCHGTPLLDASSVKWSSRKLRSNRHLKQLSQGKTSVGVESIEAHLKTNLGREVVKKDVKISQYSRRKYKSNSSACKDSVNEDKKMSGRTAILVENFGISASEQSFVASDGKSDLQLDQDVLLSNENYGSPSYENVRGDNAESQTLMEEQTMVAVKMLHSVQSYGGDVTGESSGPLRSSDISDENPQQSVECEESEDLTAVNSKDNAVSGSTCMANESTPDLVEESHTGDGKSRSPKKMGPKSKPISKTGSKRKREASPQKETQTNAHGFVKSPCEGLRPRGKNDVSSPTETKLMVKKLKTSNHSVPSKDKKKHKKGCYKCDLDGCSMSFELKTELLLHKGNRCPVEGCRKKFTSHKYAILHQRVHDDDRPLKCPWNGCTMSFKWAWARIEHFRVHTGERPYMCKVEGCGLTFRYISDFSRHRRKTGHYVNSQ